MEIRQGEGFSLSAFGVGDVNVLRGCLVVSKCLEQTTGKSVSNKKRIYFYSLNFTNNWMCLPSLTAPRLNFSVMYESSVERVKSSDLDVLLILWENLINLINVLLLFSGSRANVRCSSTGLEADSKCDVWVHICSFLRQDAVCRGETKEGKKQKKKLWLL